MGEQSKYTIISIGAQKNLIISNTCSWGKKNPLSRLEIEYSLFLRFFCLFIYIWEGRERNIMCGCLSCAPYWGPGLHATQACALTGDQTSDPLVLRLVLNPLSHTSQGKGIFLSRKGYFKNLQLTSKLIIKYWKISPQGQG